MHFLGYEHLFTIIHRSSCSCKPVALLNLLYFVVSPATVPHLPAFDPAENRKGLGCIVTQNQPIPHILLLSPHIACGFVPVSIGIVPGSSPPPRPVFFCPAAPPTSKSRLENSRILAFSSGVCSSSALLRNGHMAASGGESSDTPGKGCVIEIGIRSSLKSPCCKPGPGMACIGQAPNGWKCAPGGSRSAPPG